MVARSRKSSKPRSSEAAAKAAGARGRAPLDRPFAAGVLAEARRFASEYQIIVESEEGHWYGRGLEMPHVFGDGATPAACIEDTRQALTAAVAYLLEQKRIPPSPAKEKKRTTQVNVRLTAEEKSILETTARRKGFEGLSDFLRAAAFESLR
jgi:predicted RNase H-like HicB family nuclease